MGKLECYISSSEISSNKIKTSIYDSKSRRLIERVEEDGEFVHIRAQMLLQEGGSQHRVMDALLRKTGEKIEIDEIRFAWLYSLCIARDLTKTLYEEQISSAIPKIFPD